MKSHSSGYRSHSHRCDLSVGAGSKKEGKFETKNGSIVFWEKLVSQSKHANQKFKMASPVRAERSSEGVITMGAGRGLSRKSKAARETQRETAERGGGKTYIQTIDGIGELHCSNLTDLINIKHPEAVIEFLVFAVEFVLELHHWRHS